MDEVKLELKGYYTLLNLHKALIEAKFHLNPDNWEVSGSPFVAQVCNDITELLIQYERNTKGSDKWSEWLRLGNRPDYRDRILHRMSDCPNWCSTDLETKKKLARNYISPFTCTDTELDELISDFESNGLTIHETS